MNGLTLEGHINWERGIGAADVEVAPVRTIVITDEMRAQDAAQRAAREQVPNPDWTIKASLSEDNLRTTRRPVAAGRQALRNEVTALTRRKRVPKEVVPTRHCACGAGLARGTKGEFCIACSPMHQRKPDRQCACGAILTRRAAGDHCLRCAPSVTAQRQHDAHTPDETQRSTAILRPSPYTPLAPVTDEDLPSTRRKPGGRQSPFLPLFRSLSALKPNQWQPVKVDAAKDGYLISQALRNITKKETVGLRLAWRRDAAGTTFFFRLEDGEKAAQA